MKPNTAGSKSFDLDHQCFSHKTGRGVSVAVVDSGASSGHPHLGAIAGGVAIGLDEDGDDFVDRLGHGTAVAAAIHEKAPDAALYAVRVFEQSLSATSMQLVRAIDWASERGVRLINMSLGTANPEREAMLGAAVGRAAAKGALVVAACEFDGQAWFPGSLPQVVGVMLDPDCPRDEVRLTTESCSRPAFLASGLPRPISGVPPDGNLQGISFAVANVTGFLARLMESNADARSVDDVLRLLSA